MRRSRVATRSCRSGPRIGRRSLITTEPSASVGVPEHAQTGSVREPIETVTRIAEPWHDVAHLVQPLVEPGQDKGARYMQVLQQRGHPRDAFGGGDQADARDVVGPAIDQELYGRSQRPAGRQHGIKYVALAPRQIRG